jgi:uncharacterized membrane protein YhaH (DUF805 family)
MNLIELISPNGRVGRRSFWLTHIIGFALLIYFAAVDERLFRGGFVLLLWPLAVNSIKRWHDRDKSGWWFLIVFVPVIGTAWAIIEKGFFPGTPGANRFGDER